MWQLALGLGALGAASTLYVLWRKSKVEGERDTLKLLLERSYAETDKAVSALIDNQNHYADQDARKETVIQQLRKEIEALNATLEKLPTGSVLAGLRAEIGISDDLIDPSKE